MVTIAEASAADLDDVRTLWREYWDSFALSACFQCFEEELAGLPGAYVAPSGTLLLGRLDGTSVCTAAFRPLSAHACEMKRFYVRPEYRGQGIARQLLTELVARARVAGYTELFADTLPAMAVALDMYRSWGFKDVGPYVAQPTPGAIYLRLGL